MIYRNLNSCLFQFQAKPRIFTNFCYFRLASEGHSWRQKSVGVSTWLFKSTDHSESPCDRIIEFVQQTLTYTTRYKYQSFDRIYFLYLISYILDVFHVFLRSKYREESTRRRNEEKRSLKCPKISTDINLSNFSEKLQIAGSHRRW